MQQRMVLHYHLEYIKRPFNLNLAKKTKAGTWWQGQLVSGAFVYQCIAARDADALLNEHGEVLSANDAAWPYLARWGKHPVNGERMWIPAEVNEIVCASKLS